MEFPIEHLRLYLSSHVVLRLHGSTADVAKANKFMKGSVTHALDGPPQIRRLDYNNVIPMPTAIRKLDQQAQLKWCMDHWGTAINSTPSGNPCSVNEFDFYTPGVPPHFIIEKLSIRFRHIVFEVTWTLDGVTRTWSVDKGKPSDPEVEHGIRELKEMIDATEKLLDVLPTVDTSGASPNANGNSPHEDIPSTVH